MTSVLGKPVLFIQTRAWDKSMKFEILRPNAVCQKDSATGSIEKIVCIYIHIIYIYIHIHIHMYIWPRPASGNPPMLSPQQPPTAMASHLPPSVKISYAHAILKCWPRATYALHDRIPPCSVHYCLQYCHRIYLQRITANKVPIW